MTLEKTHLSKKVCDETSKVLSQTTAQLDQARTTITKHTADIVHIEALLKDCESADEESSSSRGTSTRSQEQKTPQPSPHRTGKRRIHMTSR